MRSRLKRKLLLLVLPTLFSIYTFVWNFYVTKFEDTSGDSGIPKVCYAKPIE